MTDVAAVSTAAGTRSGGPLGSLPSRWEERGATRTRSRADDDDDRRSSRSRYRDDDDDDSGWSAGTAIIRKGIPRRHAAAVGSLH